MIGSMIIPNRLGSITPYNHQQGWVAATSQVAGFPRFCLSGSSLPPLKLKLWIPCCVSDMYFFWVGTLLDTIGISILEFRVSSVIHMFFPSSTVLFTSLTCSNHGFSVPLHVPLHSLQGSGIPTVSCKLQWAAAALPLPGCKTGNDRNTQITMDTLQEKQHFWARKKITVYIHMYIYIYILLNSDIYIYYH